MLKDDPVSICNRELHFHLQNFVYFIFQKDRKAFTAFNLVHALEYPCKLFGFHCHPIYKHVGRLALITIIYLLQYIYNKMSTGKEDQGAQASFGSFYFSFCWNIQNPKNPIAEIKPIAIHDVFLGARSQEQRRTR